MCSSSPVRTPKQQLVTKQSSTGECWIPLKKDTSHSRAKEKSQKDGRRGKITFRIKPYTHQRCLEGSNKILCTPGPGDSTETEPDLYLSLLWRYEPAVACHKGKGLGVQLPGLHNLWNKPSWRRSPVPHHRTIKQAIHKLQNNFYQRNSCTVKKVLGLTTDFPTWGSGKRTENPQRV